MKPIPIFFTLWSILLTGMFHSYFGPPGLIQAIQLKALLHERKKKRDSLQLENACLERKIKKLQTHLPTQEKEIRNRLNYVSKDELIFYFTPSPTKAN